MRAATPTPLQVCLIADGIRRVIHGRESGLVRDIDVAFARGLTAWVDLRIDHTVRHYDPGDYWTPPEYDIETTYDIEKIEVFDENDRLCCIDFNIKEIERLI